MSGTKKPGEPGQRGRLGPREGLSRAEASAPSWASVHPTKRKSAPPRERALSGTEVAVLCSSRPAHGPEPTPCHYQRPCRQGSIFVPASFFDQRCPADSRYHVLHGMLETI